MNQAALKSPEIVYTARRFGLPDLNDSAAWLIPRLQRSWPHLQNQNIFGWFRGIIDSSEYFFVRTDHAVTLVQQIHEKLLAQPIVREHFTLAMRSAEPGHPGYVDEAVFLYGEIRQWAFRVGAAEVHLQNYWDEKEHPEQAAARLTDVPRDMVKGQFGRLFLRETYFAKIGVK